jgi:hypothetical protein
MDKPSPPAQQNYFMTARSAAQQHVDQQSYEDPEQFGEPLYDVPLFQTKAIPSSLITKPSSRNAYDVQLHFEPHTEAISPKPPRLHTERIRPSLNKKRVSRSCFSDKSVSGRETVYSRHAESEPARASRSNRSCIFCNGTDTPTWREGPGGRRTLCNVCGLIYAKRRSRGKSLILPRVNSHGTRDTVSDDFSRQS